MKTFRIELPDSPHPLWLADCTKRREFDGVVEPDGKVEVLGVRLSFRDADAPPAGTALKIWLSGFLYCATVPEYRLHQQHKAALQAMRDMDAGKSKADATSPGKVVQAAPEAPPSLPFQWRPAVKERLRSLNELSGGLTSASVVHIQMLEDFKEGRLDRKKGDFLCVAYDTKSNWDVSGQAHKLGEGLSSAITCKACQRMALRWQVPAELA